MPIAVERACVADLGKLAPLFDQYRQFYGQPSDQSAAESFLRERFSNNESVVFFAGTSSQPIGFVQLYPSFSSVSLRRLWILNDLFVSAPHRRKGIGSALLRAAEAFGRSGNAKCLVLQTAHRNIAAKALYSRAGWEEDLEFATFQRSLSCEVHK